MGISARQFNLLSQMGISLWQHKLAQPKTSGEAHTKLLKVTINQLSDNKLFHDILNSLSLSIADISCQNNTIDLGFINWQFTEHEQLSFNDKTLITPPLAQLASQSKLKKQLWQLIHTL